MSTSAAAAPAVRAALYELVDYAGLFPPAKLEMAPALAEYAAAREGAFAWMLGRFIVPASRIPELLAAHAGNEPLRLSVIVDAGSDPRVWLSNAQDALGRLSALGSQEPRLRIEALEAPLPPLASARETYDAHVGQFAAARRQAGLEALPAFLELPRDDRFAAELNGVMFALARHRLGAKLRCGGVVAQAFPAAAQVAAFITAAVEHGVPFKATAGLHHPVRRLDRDLGVTMHGFLNLLAAAAYARAGAQAAQVIAAIECEDAARLAPGADGLSEESLRATRAESFAGFGSCSFAEPVDDLRALHVL